jgi:hypothetical protein
MSVLGSGSKPVFTTGAGRKLSKSGARKIKETAESSKMRENMAKIVNFHLFSLKNTSVLAISLRHLKYF